MTGFVRWAGSAVVALSLAACSPETGAPSVSGENSPGTPTESSSQPAPEEVPEPFVLAIDAGRLSVLIGRAREGLDEGAPAVDQDEDDLVRADRELRRAALELVSLRDEICRRGRLTGQGCVIQGAPSWVFDPPGAAPTGEEISRRTAELLEAMRPFVDVGCGLGQAPQDGPGFCSVE
ncbi:MAG: hypothetical protein KGS00_05670 [Alphaproteobacteria bacterium]|nr:hypothetical protein [Alphaproteobacteria bacterium]